ncbi:MAG: PRC-barrel domain-containing protein [Phycisphaerales bacterium]|nr:PRC-barrel domain-containing protein [Phycisphaerales bacterium]
MRITHIIAVAGTLAANSSLWAQSESADSPWFISDETLMDASITDGRQSDHTGDVVDLVVDTGTGRILYAIVDTNEILGTRDRTVAIPYAALRWEPAAEQFRIQATTDQLSALPDCDPDDIDALSDPSWRKTVEGVFGDLADDSAPEALRGDQYTERFATANPTSFGGTISDIRQDATSSPEGAFCSVVLDPGDGNGERTVLLSPAGFLTKHSALPHSGDRITVTAVKASPDDDSTFVARSMELNGDELELRDERGVPAWSRHGTHTSLALASKIDDGKLTSRPQDKEFGGVDMVAYDVRSGTAAFAVISRGGVLGVGDTRYPVPWTAMDCESDQTFSIDMPIARLEKAPELSESGVGELNEGGLARRVWEYYGLEAQRFGNADGIRRGDPKPERGH